MSQQSNVSKDSAPFLHAWDTRVLTYNQFFQVHTMAAREDLAKL